MTIIELKDSLNAYKDDEEVMVIVNNKPVHIKHTGSMKTQTPKEDGTIDDNVTAVLIIN